MIAPNFGYAWFRPSRTTAPGDFTFETAAILARPDGTGTEPGFHASPYLYHVWHTDDSGGVPTDLTVETVTERWNVGVFGPGFPYGPGADFARLGDEFRFNAGLHGDQNADTSGVADAVGTTQLIRDGVVVAEEPFPGYVRTTTMAPEAATYMVRTTATRPGPPSTQVDAEWTFRSAHVEGEEPVAVPALAVRFAPNLDDHNTAPAGGKFRFPVYVQRNGSEQPGAVNTPTVEISYDDGRTWQKVRLTRHSGQWQAEVNHPRNAAFVSLRWSISDAAGNTGKATIIHAYALKK